MQSGSDTDDMPKHAQRDKMRDITTSPRGGTVTISDVARSVGVATSTVSRALSTPNRISEPMRKRIFAAAAELGYVPNPQAKALTSGRTLRVALLVPDITNPYFFDLIRGTQSQLKQHGYRHILVDSENSLEVEAAALAELPGSVDGLIVMGAHPPFERLLEVADRTPLVVINREIEGIPSVVVDTPTAMAEVVAHLASLGHTDIAYLAGRQSSWSCQMRWQAIEAASIRLGVRCRKIGPFDLPMPAGAAEADAALEAGVTACIFFNDLLAIRALQRFAALGIVVPDRMSVVGCDDIFGADFCNPPLTTLTAPTEQVGRVATDMLLRQIQEQPTGQVKNPYRVKVPARLTIRSSTGVRKTR